MSDEIIAPQLIDETQTKTHESNVAMSLLAGTCGGIAQVLTGQPFDTTKVRLQTSTDPNTSAIKVVKDLIKNEGFKGFYKGTLTPLIGVGACVSVQFGVNEAMKSYFQKGDASKTLTLPQYFACGAAAGFANAPLASPIEHIRIRLQVEKSATANNGPLQVISKLRKHNALMRGLVPTMLRDGAGVGMYFAVYEGLVAKELNSHPGMRRSDIAAWKLCSFGGFSGCMLWMFVYPIDVAKSVFQTSNLATEKNLTTRRVLQNLYAKNGLKGLTRGFGPTLIRAAPANAATFLAFEATMRLLA
ncbi:hypothetical protein ACO0RG_003529 [Hanseniaspora osmophila]|uniref:Carrier protein YMC1, mitochondrial n=1 Tax=Hanseniaspora osmophila TaxID=56408 RepID=A0A1E5RE71_9ASCO|nr:Carrier protein YMC1, mitochondrial [Hanseniaspora osmophila]